MEATQLRTSTIELISSIHGTQRRAERAIDVKDLKSAIKHGKKEPQIRYRNGCKQIRNKYTFADVVYITDEFSRIEITSYVLPLPLDNYQVLETEQHQYLAAKRRINENPLSITSHAVFVVDCSGSMKNSDVVAHRCRLDAVQYGIAVEFIAKRLHNPSSGVTQLDVVTIIEMRDEAKVVFEKEPVSWVLYNKLVDHAKSNKPSSHGNYYPSLQLAHKWLKDQDHPNLALLLFFLSDGRPSDESFGVTMDDILFEAQMIGLEFRKRLNFGMVGFGRPLEDMSVLDQMATRLSMYGAVGKFHRSDLKKVDSLSTSIATMASTLTSTRTLLTAARSDRMQQKAFNLTEFSKNVMSPQRDWEVKTVADHYLTRYELVQSQTLKQFVWKEIPLVSAEAVGISFSKNPFGKGAERLVYQLCEIDKKKRKVGQSLVMKNSKYEGNYDFRKYHESFCKSQKIAANTALRFNQRLDRTPQISDKVPRVKFLDCYVYSYYDGYDELNILVEREIDHHQYTKWNDNTGGVLGQKRLQVNLIHDQIIEEEEEEDEEISGEVEPTVDSEDEENFYGVRDLIQHRSATVRRQHRSRIQMVDILDEEVPQAFTHFSYTWSNREKMVCDLQGVLDKAARVFEFTDPAIHYASKSGRRHVYGRTDKGKDGMREFFKTHKCNKLCEALGISQERM